MKSKIKKNNMTTWLAFASFPADCLTVFLGEFPRGSFLERPRNSTVLPSFTGALELVILFD